MDSRSEVAWRARRAVARVVCRRKKRIGPLRYSWHIVWVVPSLTRPYDVTTSIILWDCSRNYSGWSWGALVSRTVGT